MRRVIPLANHVLSVGAVREARDNCDVSASIQIVDCGQPEGIVVATCSGFLSAEEWNDARSWMTARERDRYESEVVGRAERFLAGRWLIRTLVATELKCPPDEVLVSASCTECGLEHGAPEVRVAGERVWVSLSHSVDTHALVLSRMFRVGIDIESHRDDVPVWTWVENESLAKLDGIGLTQPPRALPGEAVVRFEVPGFVGALAWAPTDL